ncbi:glycosyltransferase family 9 protein [Robertkochia aurantiaca]|uniref:glycosyltransferase family 9 protein n=1 Tax=Robertkochia aurantiaca TaxID=2873700 RepID=UPI001CCF016A|nr:glycosyltransferase family 9 protein [Robertkochia sp. 3YJGBD-33]
MKILIIQQKMIGDVLTSTILCENIKRFAEDASVYFMAHEGTLPVLLNNPYIDEIIPFRAEYRENYKSLFQFIRTIDKNDFDVIIDVYGKLETNLIVARMSASQKIGYYKWYSNFLYTHPVKRSGSSQHGLPLAIEDRLRLLQPVLPEISPDDLRHQPRIYLSDEEKKEAADFLKKHNIDRQNKIFMISVLGSGSNKTYPYAYMARLLDKLVSHQSPTLLFNYIPSQQTEVQAIYELCLPETRNHIRLDAFAPSLRGFMGILSECDALIGNEGGAVNMAKALDIPTFAIFSPWIPREGWGLFEGEKHQSVHLKDFHEQFFSHQTVRHLRKKSIDLYRRFSPDLIWPRLKTYLESL